MAVGGTLHTLLSSHYVKFISSDRKGVIFFKKIIIPKSNCLDSIVPVMIYRI